MKKNYIHLIILFVFLIFFKFFENSYVILKYDYQTRLTNEYGFCSKTSYGFIKHINKKYNIQKNIKIINDENYPSSESFIHKPKVSYNKNYLILLNYKDKGSKVNLDNYKVIEKIQNCFYLKKND